MPWRLTSKETLEDITREANPRLGTCGILSAPREPPPWSLGWQGSARVSRRLLRRQSPRDHVPGQRFAFQETRRWTQD
jgi:hypothetical protein